MKHVRALSSSFLKVVAQTETSQVASLTLRPGQVSSEFDNPHPRSEQWVYVVSGVGTARIGPRRVKVSPGSLLLIERGEPHQITGEGDVPLVALNLYVPPVFDDLGEVLPTAKAAKPPAKA